MSGTVNCVDPDPQNTVTDRMQLALNTSGAGYILSLCPSRTYYIVAPLNFTSPNQEISTAGYPIPQENGTDLRATLAVSGPVALGSGHTTAIQGTCGDCDGIKIRNLRINGTRDGAGPTNGGGNIEIGGSNSGQLVEYVKSFDPRSWTCLHIFEGSLDCTNVTIRYNDIGPCGSDVFQHWADGISMACRNSWIHGNYINTATDGGIVLFGSPGTIVENNTIWVETNTMIGGINLVDYDPFKANFTGTIVRNNTIRGGFATTPDNGPSKGDNNETAIIKMGIAVGPRVWFGDRYGSNNSMSGTVLDNELTGAFGYAIGMDSAINFTVQGNKLFGNTSFIGSRGPNCSESDSTPTPAPFIYDANRVVQSSLQADFVAVPDADSLTCIVPSDGNYWPFGGDPTPHFPGEGGGGTGNNGSDSGGENEAQKIGLGVGIPIAVIAVAVLAWYLRRRYLAHHPLPRTPPMSRSRAHNTGGYSRTR